MIRKLKYRFVIVATLSVFAVLLAVLITINALFWRHSVSQADNLLDFLADNNGGFSSLESAVELPENDLPATPNTEEIDPSNPAPLPPEFRKNKEIAFRTRCFSVLYDTAGTISQVRTDRIAAISDSDAQSMATQVLERKKDRGFSGIYRFSVKRREDGIIVAFLDCNDTLNSFRALNIISAAILLFCLIAVFLLVLSLSDRIIRPFASSIARQKQFIADAGHELKTPLTIINANIAVLAMTGCDNEWTQSIHSQTHRLSDLVQELLTLSRVETAPALPMETFNLSLAARESVSAFAALIQSMERQFTSDIQDNVMFFGNEDHLRRLISILLDNAAKYTPEGGDVRFSLKKVGRFLQIEAHNTCAPLEKRHLGHLFERFYRADAARARETGGYGIGLSIAQEIVEKHHGKIRACCPVPDRIIFSISLPVK